MVMVALLFFLAVFVLGFVTLVLIYNARTSSFSNKHREQHLKELDEQLKEGKITKEDYIELRKKL